MGAVLKPIAYALQHLTPPPMTSADAEGYPKRGSGEGRPAAAAASAAETPSPAAAAATAVRVSPPLGGADELLQTQSAQREGEGGEIHAAEEMWPLEGGREGETEEEGKGEERFTTPVGTWEAASPELDEEIKKLEAVVGLKLPGNISVADKAKALSAIVGVEVKVEVEGEEGTGVGMGGMAPSLSPGGEAPGRMAGRKVRGRRGVARKAQRAVEEVKEAVGVA